MWKLDIFILFVNSFWKKSTGRIVSLVIVIRCLTFLLLFSDVIKMSLLTGSFLLHLDSRILWIQEEYFSLTYDPHGLYQYCNTKDKISYTIKVQNRRKHLEEQIVSGKYWAAAGQHETILQELHDNIIMQEFIKKIII